MESKEDLPSACLFLCENNGLFCAKNNFQLLVLHLFRFGTLFSNSLCCRIVDFCVDLASVNSPWQQRLAHSVCKKKQP